VERLGPTFTLEMEVRARTRRDLRCMLMIRSVCGDLGAGVVLAVDEVWLRDWMTRIKKKI
jgi:hypothetical protein